MVKDKKGNISKVIFSFLAKTPGTQSGRDQ